VTRRNQGILPQLDEWPLDEFYFTKAEKNFGKLQIQISSMTKKIIQFNRRGVLTLEVRTFKTF
jgi:hypothetical protein